MKARVIKDVTMYKGQVYINNKWETVAKFCYTKRRCKRKVKKWVKDNYPEEFEV